jgi:hypothetical protein
MPRVSSNPQDVAASMTCAPRRVTTAHCNEMNIDLQDDRFFCIKHGCGYVPVSEISKKHGFH